MSFALHPRLEHDSHAVGELPLCLVRLLDVVLVPARAGAVQVGDLAPADQLQLWAEILQVQATMQRLWRPDRVNLGVIGLAVPQLHVHLVARFEGDALWPRAVWGHGEPRAYARDKLAPRLESLRAALA